MALSSVRSPDTILYTCSMRGRCGKTSNSFFWRPAISASRHPRDANRNYCCGLADGSAGCNLKSLIKSLPHPRITQTTRDARLMAVWIFDFATGCCLTSKSLPSASHVLAPAAFMCVMVLFVAALDDPTVTRWRQACG